MPRVRLEDGTVINFEGTPTPQDIDFAYQQARGGAQTPQAPADTNPFPTGQDFLRSGQEYVGNMAQAVMHPIQTAQGMGNMAMGLGQKLIPGQQAQEPYADQLGQFIQQRYGSFDKAMQTLKHDPVGMMADASSVLSMGGGAVSRIPTLAKVGRVASRAGAMMDPLTVTTNAAKFAGKVPGHLLEKSQLGLASRSVNSLIKPTNRQFSYGKNPGLAVAQEGIVAGSLEELAQKAGERTEQLTQQLIQVVSDPKVVNTRKNNLGALNPITKAIGVAKRNPRTNANVILRLENLRDDLLGVVVNPDGSRVITKDLSNMNPVEMLQFKRTLGDLTKWTDNFSDDSAVNAAMKQAYTYVRKNLESAVPGIAPTNDRLANLIDATNAARAQALAQQRRSSFGLTDAAAAGAGGVIGGVTGHLDTAIVGSLLAYGAKAAVQSPYVRTQLATWMAHATPTEVTAFFNRVPGLKEEILQMGLMAGTTQQRVQEPQMEMAQ